MVLLEAVKITKRFPGVLALDEVDLTIDEGQIHCIVGENGAGKSTLVKVFEGIYNAEGNLFINGKEMDLKHPKLISDVSFVPQELNLFINLSVAENLFVPFANSRVLFSKRKYEKLTNEYIEKFKMKVRPNDTVKYISTADQQLLQIARALSNEAKIIIMDEPTSSLTRDRIDILFSIIKLLKEQGKSIIFITHKLDEVFELGDVVSILRNGKMVGNAKIGEIDPGWVIKRMTGKEINLSRIYRPTKPFGKKILEVKNLNGINFKDISFDLREGEILGFAGLVGAGKSEIMQTIFGYLSAFSGDINAVGKKWKLQNPSFSVDNGLIYLPEERKTHGILPNLNVRENIGVMLPKLISNFGIVSRRKDKKVASKIIKDYRIETSSSETKIIFLSGGNQQKVILGRAMEASPKILLLDEPTRGIDIGSKEEIYSLMKRIAEEHRVGILFISSELEELVRCSNRIITIYQGHRFDEYIEEKINMEDIVSSVIGIKKSLLD
jgi:ABC-type sugar transport system ATPase subunit